MMDPHATAAPGHYGVASCGVTFAPLAIAAAWNLQGRASPPLLAKVQELFAASLPSGPDTVVKNDALSALWLGPSSWLLLTGSPSMLAGNFVTRRDALNEVHGALFDVSASRIGWTIAGPHAVDVLSSGCPLDFHASVFRTRSYAQSVFGHVNVLIEKIDEAPTFNVLVARSFAHDTWHAMDIVARQYDYDVLETQPYR